LLFCCCVYHLLQAFLADLALEDFLLNGAGSEQAVHIHALALAIAPHLQAAATANPHVSHAGLIDTGSH
jgi:hypothetical protein